MWPLLCLCFFSGLLSTASTAYGCASLIQQTCDTCCRGGPLSQLRIRYSVRSGGTHCLDGAHSSTRSEESTSSRGSSFHSLAPWGWRRSLGRFSSCDHSLVTRG